MSESENREENRKKLLYRYMGNGMFEPVEPAAESRNAEELLRDYGLILGGIASRRLAKQLPEIRARLVELVAKGLEAEKAIEPFPLAHKHFAHPASGDTAKCPPHRPVGGGEYGSSFHGDIICGDCGKDLSDEPATGAFANESPVTASAKCPKCSGEKLVWTELRNVYCHGCGADVCTQSIADFAQFFTKATDRLPEAEELAKKVWELHGISTKWESVSDAEREGWIEDAALTMAALASLTGERNK